MSEYKARINRIRERLREISAPFRVINKTTKPWAQAKNRIFNGNARSVRTVPLKTPTPAPRVLSFTKLRSKSLKFPAAAPRKAHPVVCIPPFSAFIQSTQRSTVSNPTDKNKDRTFPAAANCLFGLRLGNRKSPCFQKDSWKGVDCSRESAIFTFCVEFEIIGDSACWKRAENSGIQTDGCAFPGKVGWESGDFGMAVVKLKTGNPALRFTMEMSARNASFHCEFCF